MNYTKNERSHRVAYALRHGTIRPGAHIMHSCDNKLCVNVDHLTEGTAADNAAEAARRGRLTSKVSDEVVVSMRRDAEAGTTLDDLAAKYGVNKAYARAVCAGKTRKHVGGPFVRFKGTTRLSPQAVFAIRVRVARGDRQVDLAREHGVSESLISRIKRGTRWPTAGGPVHET